MQCGFQLAWQLIIFIAILLWMAQSLIKAVERVMAPDAWIICTHFRVKIWGGRGKGIIKANRSLLCLGLKADSLPHAHFRQMPLANVSRRSSSSLPRRTFSPAQSQHHLCGLQVRHEREKPASSSFYSFHWFAVSFTFTASSLLLETKMQLPNIWRPDTCKSQFEQG